MKPIVQDALDRLFGMVDDYTLTEFRDAITEELCAITGSELSYFAAMNLEQDTLTMIGWSRSAMGACGVADKPIVYDLEDTGLWGDAVRESGPVITNDYQGLDKPTKKGYPQGHVHVKNHMNLPIWDGDRVALVVGVGNRKGDYDMEDIRNVEDLMEEIWETFRQKLWEATW